MYVCMYEFIYLCVRKKNIRQYLANLKIFYVFLLIIVYVCIHMCSMFCRCGCVYMYCMHACIMYVCMRVFMYVCIFV